jgi:hypothetical protein
VLSISAAASVLGRYVSLNVAPGGIGEPGPLQYILSTHTLERLDVTSREHCPVEAVIAEGDRAPNLTGRHEAADERRRELGLTQVVDGRERGRHHVPICKCMKAATTQALALLLALAPACGGGDPAAEADLRAAVKRTIAADSYHVRIRLTQGGAGAQSIEGDYVAPDRFSIQGEAVKTLVIGRHRYISYPDEDRDRYYVAGELSCPVTPGEFFPPLAVFREAQDVSRFAGTYVFKLDALSEGAWGRARLTGGRLAFLSLHYTLPMFDGLSEYQFTFSDFDAPISVEPPSAKQVIDDSRFEDLGPIVGFTGSPIPCP